MKKGIFYDEKEKIFSIEGESFSYVFYVNQYGILVNLHLGEKLTKPLDKSSLVKEDIWNDYRYLKDGKEVQLPGDGFVMEWTPVEVGSYGRNDFRVPFAVISQKNDQVRTTDFRYVSYEIKEGREPLSSFPYGQEEEGVSTLILTLKESESELYLQRFYVYYPRLDMLLTHSCLTNKTGEEVVVKRLASVEMDFRSSSYCLRSFGGGYAHEFLVSDGPLQEGKKVISSCRGLSSHEANPSFLLHSPEANETEGFVIGGSLIYSGDFSFEFEVDSNHQLRFVGGVNPETFSYHLKDKETLECPEMAIAFSGHGFQDISSSFHSFVRDDIVKEKEKGLSDYVLLNSWEAYYFDFDTKKVMEAIDKAHSAGISLFVLDDGWFGKRNTDTCSLGDWFPNESKINLPLVIAHCHSLGMKFGLWVEPEMISMESELYKRHPDWAILSHTSIHSLHRHQLLLDLGKNEVSDYLFMVLDKLLSTLKVDYVKWDYNSDSYEHSSFDAACFRRYRNLYKLLSDLGKAHLDIFLETCAGGGGRFDLAMMSYSSRIWASDNQDSSDRSYIQYGASFFYPPETISAHVNKAKDDISFRIKEGVAFFGSFGYELDPSIAPMGLVKEGVDLFDEFHDIISKGRYYRLLSPYSQHAYGAECQYEGKLALLLNPLVGYDGARLFLADYDHAKDYVNPCTSELFTPERLSKGLTPKDFSSSPWPNVLLLAPKR